MISCENYVNWMLQACAWDTVSNTPFPWASDKIPSLLPEDTIHQVFKQNSLDERKVVDYAIELKQGFVYHCTLLGEMMYV